MEIENRVNGLLVPVNDVKALSDAVIKVCAMLCGERADMGYKARKFIIENCSVKQITDQWMALIERLEKNMKEKKFRKKGMLYGQV